MWGEMWGMEMVGSSKIASQHRVKSGPHVEKKLNAAFVRSAGPGRYSDGGGLYLQVDDSGARRWILRVVVQGRRRDFGLGSAMLVSLASARHEAIERRRIARAGGNPKIMARERQGLSLAFKDLARQVHERKFKEGKSNGKHVAQWLRTLETYAFPIIGDLSIEDVNQDDIEAVIDPIWNDKSETARRVLQRISTVFDFACGRGYRTRGNPVAGLRTMMRKQEQQPKNFAALDYLEVPDLMKALAKSDSVGALALKITTLTALRSAPVRNATWGQFDRYLSRWEIPAKSMKTKKDFVVPLSPPVREILASIRPVEAHPDSLVFPSPQHPQRPISENTMRKLLQTHYPGVTVHGMRAAFRTWAKEVVAAPDDVAEMTLAHAIGTKTTQAYNRAELLDEREMLLEKWGMWAMGELNWFTDSLDIDAEIWRRRTSEVD